MTRRRAPATTQSRCAWASPGVIPHRGTTAISIAPRAVMLKPAAIGTRYPVRRKAMVATAPTTLEAGKPYGSCPPWPPAICFGVGGKACGWSLPRQSSLIVGGGHFQPTPFSYGRGSRMPAHPGFRRRPLHFGPGNPCRSAGSEALISRIVRTAARSIRSLGGGVSPSGHGSPVSLL